MQTPSFCLRPALAAAAVLLLCCSAPTVSAQGSCTPVTTRILGVAATNCTLPSPAQQATQPVCEIVNDGFPAAYWLVSVTNQPAGSAIANGNYRGWCADYDVSIESGIQYKPVAYLSTQPLPPHLADPNWSRINYILNHKQGSAFDVQAAIWRFIGGPVSPFDPVFGTLTAAGSNLVAAATLYGAGYLPGPGEVSAVILDVGPGTQLHFIEVSCPAVLQACPSTTLTLCTTNTGSGPLAFAWFRNNLPIPGATGQCLTLPALTSADSGTIAVRVSNACSAATNSFLLQVSNTSDAVAPILTCAPTRNYQCADQIPAAPDLAAVSATDNNGTAQVSFLGETRLTNGCELRVTRRYQAVDGCGNTATCERTDIARDTTPPTLTCASNTIAQCGGTWTFTPPAVLDNCAGTNVTLAILSTVTNAGPCPGIFSVIRTWRATDACGNAATCSQTVNVTDTLPPVLTCASNRVEDCGTLWSFTEPAANDLCSGTNVSLTILSTVTNAGSCPGAFSATRTWRATDACGNTATCSQTINVTDTTPPEITCAPDATVSCGTAWDFTPPLSANSGLRARPAFFQPAGGLPQPSNPCGDTNVTITILSTVTNTSGFCPGTFSVTRTWQAMDACGNATTCSQTITVLDTTPPTLTCAPNRTVECATPWSFNNPAATDLCAGTNVTLTILNTVTNAGACGRSLAATRTWRATDACGNSATCSQTITVTDTTPPTLTCASNRTVECATSWSFNNPSATDLCDGTNVTLSILNTVTNAGSCGRSLAATRTWRATDACGNTATCSQTITVLDTIPPTLTCASNRTVECATSWSFNNPSATDLCDGTNVTLTILNTVTNAGACGRSLAATRTWRATDACGNSATCSQTITVLDTIPPTLTCASNRTVECGQAWSFNTPAATDLCDGTNVALSILTTVTNTAACAGAYSATRTWQATDACGNAATCSQTITIVDTTPPTLACASNATMECSQPWSFTAPTASDLCSGSNVTLTILNTVTNAGACGRSLTATRTWRATDACGNTATCSQTITVLDTIPPTLTCASNRTVECATSWSFNNPSATDLCDGTNITLTILNTVTNAGSCGRSLAATRTWRATDACGNTATCSQTITVLDTTPPTLTCASNRTVECATSWSFNNPSATDLCDGTNVTLTILNTVTNAGSCGRSLAATRTWRATDACGNSATCSQTITVLDTIPPTLTCASNATLECGTPWTFAQPAATDLCDGTNVTLSVLSTITNAGPCGRSLAATRTWRATDACGNSTTCSQTITVVDTTPPTITCAADAIMECGTAWEFASPLIAESGTKTRPNWFLPAFNTPLATDLCDGTNITLTILSTTTNSNGRCQGTYSATRTWQATDACGNRATCSQTITVVDTTPPTITCAPNATVECSQPWAFTAPTASDFCGGTNTSISIVSTVTNAGPCGRSVTITRTWRALDACSNSTSCSQTITVVDTTPPTITCAPNATVECSQPWAFTAPTASDLCDGTNVTLSILSTVTNSGACGRSLAITRTWRALDACSNSASCSQTITVVDTTPPTITCAPNATVECSQPWAFTASTASDLCDGTNVTLSILSTVTNAGPCGRSLVITRTWKATDACSNSTSCSQTITLVDTTPPTITCAPNATVECSQPWAFTAPTASDLCDGTNVTLSILSTVTNAGPCGRSLVITRTWKATDACSNSTSCSQTITVVDTTPPTITCAPDATVECSQPWAFTAPTASDLCDGSNVTLSILSTVTNAGPCGRSLFITRTWRALDACSNSASCSQTITLVDTTPPTFTCAPNATVECSQPWAFTAPTASDLCDGTNVTLSILSTVTNAGPCGRSLVITRTWKATDACSNSTSCSQTITVVDTTPPTITCAPDATVECSQPWAFTAPTASDLCDGSNVTLSVLSTVTNAGPCGRSLVITRTWRALDACSNSASCSQTITIVDTTPPTITCAPDATVECSQPWAFTAPTATDLCDGSNVTLSILSTVTNAGPCGRSLAITRTWRALDACSNSASCSQTITIVDTIPPTITCAPNATVECSQPWAFTAPTASDLCDGTNVTLSILSTVTNSGACGRSLAITRTWRALDACSNSASCSQTITVVDTTPPTITCAPDATVECSQPWAFTAPTATDLCDRSNVTLSILSTVTNAGPCGRSLAITRTWQATDACSNSASCSQTITIVDTTPPTITCAPDATVECSQPWAFTAPTASDLCDGTNVTLSILSTVTNAGPCGRSLAITRTWRALDACSNSASCSQTITIVDTTPPTITCAPDATVECSQPWAFTAPTASDLCDGTNVAVTVLSTVTNAGACGRSLVITRTWRALDACSNSASCSQTITVVDTTPPTITCAPDATVECSQPWTFTAPTASDLCDGTNIAVTVLSTVTNAGPCGRSVAITRTWQATDACSNSASCSQTITIVDTTPPTITCAPDATVECSQTWSFTEPTATDLCDGTNLTLSVLSTVTNAGSCGRSLVITRTWQATDACSNSASCSQTITIVDTTPPTITCAPDATVECNQPWSFTAPTASDLCDDTNLTFSILSTVTNAGSCGRSVVITRTWQATDACSNSASCSQTITIVDTTPPTITCAPDATVECSQPWAFTTPTASDLCDGTDVTITVLNTITNAGPCGRSLAITRTWRALDACSNSASCSQTITIVDTTPPTITCAPNATVECSQPWAFTAPTASDLCDGTNVTLSVLSTVTNAGACGRSLVITRTWRALDACSNSASCSQTITVVDTTPPTITCAPDATVECSQPWTFTAPTASDLCDGTNVAVTVLSTVTNAGACGRSLAITRTWQALDACSNSASCSQTITIVDTTPPTITCAPDATVECSQPWAFTTPTASDLCDGTNVTLSVLNTVTNAGACGRSVAITRTWQATDACSNSASCSQTITIVDTTPPTITCAPDATVECSQPWSFTAPTASDLCDGANVAVTVLSTVTNAGPCGRSLAITRTWRALDACSNSASCSQTITIVDTTPPTITCAPNATVECSQPWSFTAPTASDLCDGTNLTLSILSTVTNAGPCGRSLAITRTWRALDACSNSASCSQTITIVDTTPPTITCAPDATVECSQPWSFTEPTATDLCDGTNVAVTVLSTVTNAGACGRSLAITRTWRALDACSNSTSCSQTITVVDTTPPTITCAPNATVECSQPWAFTTPTASDLCDGTDVTITVLNTVTNAGACGRSVAITRTWQATDACSNSASCSQTITIVDTTPPTITCAPDATVECSQPWAFTAPTASDLCDGTDVTITVLNTITNAGPCGRSLAITRTWQAIDACSNSASCSQTITIVDTTPPTLTCAPDATVECSQPWAFTAPTASDLCDGTNVTLSVLSTVTNAGPCGRSLAITRTWQAIDACSNSASCSQTITIVDTTPPTITCAPDATVECSQPWAFTAPTASDLCDGTNLTLSVLSTITNAGACGRSLAITRTWRALDACSNSASCSQTITVVDTTPPTLVCAADRIVECSQPWAFTAPTASDLCDGTNVTLSILSTVTNAGPCGRTLAVTRTWRALDACSNSTSCSQTITVVDTVPPTLVCAADRVVECGIPWAFQPPTAMDLCDGTNVSVLVVGTVTNAPSPDCPHQFTVVRTWQATDRCGNRSTCSQTVLITDSTPPTLTCAPDRIVECGQSWTFGPVTASDLCDGTNVTLAVTSTVTNAHPSCARAYTVVRTWTAADRCGNLATCSQSVTVVDTTPPTLACAANIIVECSQPWTFTPPSAEDICDGTNVQVRITSTVTNNLGCGRTLSVTRTWRAFDSCSNVSQCSQTITVVDTMPPTLTCADNRVVECGTPWEFTRPAVMDACNGTNVTLRILSTTTNTTGLCGRTYRATRTWEALDACTNRSTCSQTITVVDTTPPVLTCASNRVVECGVSWTFNPPTVADVCDTNVTLRILGTVTNAGPCGRTFASTRTWEAVDACGNRSTCSQTITLLDTTPPVLTCAPNRVVECATPWEFTPPTATDLCDAAVTIRILGTVTNAGPCGRTLAATRTWEAVDACGNRSTCSQTITTEDRTPPTLICGPELTVECSQPWAFTPPSATDTCSGAVRIDIVATVTNTAGLACPQVRTIRRTWRATDECGNTADGSQTIVFLDTVPPVLSGVPADTRYACLASVPAPAAVTSSDVCDPSPALRLTTVTNGSCPTVITRTWTAWDACSNQVSASQVITVVESAPVITSAPLDLSVCPGSNATFCVTATGECGLTYEWSKDGVVLPGENGPCLTVSNAGPADVGRYCVAVRSPCHAVTNCAVLTLIPHVDVGLIPAPLCLLAGTNLTLCPPITGPGPYTCAWYHNGIKVEAAGTNCCLQLNAYGPAMAGTYTLFVTGICNVASSEVTLPAPRLSCGPDNCNDQVLCEGGTFTLCETTVQPLPGVAYHYQWFRTIGIEDIFLTGETNTCLTRSNATPADAGFYGVRVIATVDSGSTTQLFCGGIITILPRTVAEGPQDVMACEGTNVQFRVAAGGTGPFAYQWFKDGALLPGQTNDTLTVNGATPAQMGLYCVVVEGLCGSVTNCARLTLRSAIGDLVWEDLNFNGCQDPGEPGLTDLTVELIACASDTVVRTTVTDVTGRYRFDCVEPGNYRVRIVPPAGPWMFTSQTNAGCGTNGDSDAHPATGMTRCFTLPPGTTDLSWDAGLARKSCLGDVVWEDLNHDGIQNPGEPCVPGAELRLYDCTTSNLVATAISGMKGGYLFCDLVPGSYRVQILPPAGYDLTLPHAGANDCLDSDADPATGFTDCVLLKPGETNRCVDLGLRRYAGIGDLVWNDLNRDGRQDAGEPGLPGIEVRLYDCATMTLLGTQLTDAAGGYLFGGLTGGTYKVQFIAPAGLLVSPFQAAGVPEDLNSDANPATGLTPCYTIYAGQTNRSVDAGLHAPLAPCLKVTKQVACLLPGNQCGPLAKSATGYRSADQNPGFCYSITLSNCGGCTLTNLTVLDDKMGDLTATFFPGGQATLAPGASLTRHYKMAWDTTTTNRVTAVGRADTAGAPQVRDADEAVAHVLNASLTCQTIVFSPDDQDTSFTDGHVTLIDDGLAHDVTFAIVVCNTGDADLTGVTIRTPGLELIGCADPAPFDLPRGACVTNILCARQLNCAVLPISLTNHVTAMVDTRTQSCGHDLNGSNIVARTECHMDAECGMPGACRVTGGGRQENSLPAVRYVTHGGQVGAPVGREGFDPGTYQDEGSPCIHGNWEHVRHEKGGSRGNFHAKIFDSLMCACLGCPEDPLAPVVIGGLCNPDNRACGPEPRRAPANKICFSGIGDYTLTSGNRESRSVLFRVDIEDRSEPGNSSAGGTKPPNDRHRIRIWILTEAEKARLANPNDRLLDFRRAIACTPGNTSLKDGAVGPDGQAVPLGTAVFGVRAPDIDDGGEMDHGNHQIHPMIKACPK